MRAKARRQAPQRMGMGMGVGSTGRLEAELRAVAAAGEHPCAVGTSRVWTDPQLTGVPMRSIYAATLAGPPPSARAVSSIGNDRKY